MPISHKGLGIASGIAFAAAVGSYVAVAWFSTKSVWPREWQYGPKPDLLLDRYAAVSDDRTIAWEAVDSYASAYLQNETPYTVKLDGATWGLVALVAETLTLALSLTLLALGY